MSPRTGPTAPECGTITEMTTAMPSPSARSRVARSTRLRAASGRTRSPAATRSPRAAGWLVIAALLPLTLAACTADTSDIGGTQPSGAPTAVPTGDTAATAGTGLVPPDADAVGGRDDADAPTPTAVPPGPPQAATLRWLDGADIADGVFLGNPGAQRWFGRAAGETAFIGDGWYRYFGPDGSLVGCTSAGACVGIAGDDTLAVVSAPGEPRDIYRTDGTYLGRYGPDGDVLGTTPADALSFVDAITGTGVDISGLVEAAAGLPTFAGGVTGDPHVVTSGGQRYTTQLGGRFVARTGDRDHLIELQFGPMAHRDDVSVVTSVALGVGSDVVVSDLSGSLTINDATALREPEFSQKPLPQGGVVGRWPVAADGIGTIVVAWPDGSTVTLTANRALGMTVIAHLAQSATGGMGLFGDDSGTTGRDLLTRGGTVAADAGGVQVAVASWRMVGTAGLFPRPAPPISGLADDPIELDAGAQVTAKKLCSAAALRTTQDVTACAFDVALTGDTGFVPGHLALSTAATVPRIPAEFARRWPAVRPPSTAAGSLIPDDGQLAVTLAAGVSRTYRLTIDQPGDVRMVAEQECAAGGGGVAMDEPAWRVFTATGLPVTSRLPLCGATVGGPLAAGDYLLVVGNGLDRPELDLVAQVLAP